jgi:hypothetical protein
MVEKLSLLRMACDSPLDTIESAEAEHLARKAPDRHSRHFSDVATKLVRPFTRPNTILVHVYHCPPR